MVGNRSKQISRSRPRTYSKPWDRMGAAQQGDCNRRGCGTPPAADPPAQGAQRLNFGHPFAPLGIGLEQHQLASFLQAEEVSVDVQERNVSRGGD